MTTDSPSTTPSDVQKLVNEQAEDEGLWFDAATASEAYLQQELRKLHAAIEDDLPPSTERLWDTATCPDCNKILNQCSCPTVSPSTEREAKHASEREALAIAANEVLQCAKAWEPQARILGNVTALDVANVAIAALTHARTTPQGVSEEELQKQIPQWLPIETAPKDGAPILIHHINYYGKSRIIRACYIPKFFEENSNEWAEYSEEKDCYYTPEGWYELCDEHDEYSSLHIHNANPDYWQPLPTPPALTKAEQIRGDEE